MTERVERQCIELEQGWDFLYQNGVKKVINLLEGNPEETQIDPELYMQLYTTVFTMCTQEPPHDYSDELYARYRECFEEYNNAMVLPAVQSKQDEDMLRELVRRWKNHKVMVGWLSRFFNYLERKYIKKKSLPSLTDVGDACFRDLVYKEVKRKVTEAVILQIDRERDGEEIDRGLLKDVVGVFVVIGRGGMDAYQNDFEVFVLEDTAHYYQRKASLDFEEEQYLIQEKERVEHYLYPSTESKLLEIMPSEEEFNATLHRLGLQNLGKESSELNTNVEGSSSSIPLWTPNLLEDNENQLVYIEADEFLKGFWHQSSGVVLFHYHI